jgi:hypothetical protein
MTILIIKQDSSLFHLYITCFRSTTFSKILVDFISILLTKIILSGYAPENPYTISTEIARSQTIKS